MRTIGILACWSMALASCSAVVICAPASMSPSDGLPAGRAVGSSSRPIGAVSWSSSAGVPAPAGATSTDTSIGRGYRLRSRRPLASMGLKVNRPSGLSIRPTLDSTVSLPSLKRSR
jgi:hypothetical protein